MHHQDFSGDPPGTGPRKSAYHLRRGSSGASASSTAGAPSVTADESCAQAGSSSPAPHHQTSAPGTQVKKKSGFQITSVTSAQINVSGNNSLADDTESYDDMDESHTEELSSSDILDVSASRATEGVPGRSSSDETLHSLHGVDTPGLGSPNEHVHVQVPQVSGLMNGTVTPHVYPHPPLLHDTVPGAEAAGTSLPIAPLASSSPNIVSKVGTSQSQRMPMLDNTRPADVEPQCSSVPPAADPVSVETGAAHSTHSQHPPTQSAPGSRFRVVKLDTNSEPFRKGRWTCTEYYEKEVPHSTASEAAKGLEVSAETEAPNVSISPAAPAPLQSYQLPNQDFTSPPAMQSPPQGVPQSTPLPYVPAQDGNMSVHLQKTLTTGVPQAVPQPSNLVPQQLPYAVDPGSAYLHTGVAAAGTMRQPDFIQPTAPFQSQVQPPLPLMSVPHTPAVPPQASSTITQQLGAHTQGGPPPPALFPTVQPASMPAPPLQLQPQPVVQSQPLVQPQPVVQPPALVQPQLPVPVAPPHGAQALPLTALQADLQPLLAPTASINLAPAPGRSSHLEDAHRLLFQHQGLLGLPRLGVPGVSGAEGTGEGGSTGAALVHMGMSAEASAFMAAAAAGLRSHAEGEEDSSSGASVVAIDNKIEQAMDLVKSHLMYAVREEVEVLKEQIKELNERNSQLEQENNLLKTLASPEQMAQFRAQVQTGSSPTGPGQPAVGSAGTQAALPPSQNTGMSA